MKRDWLDTSPISEDWLKGWMEPDRSGRVKWEESKEEMTEEERWEAYGDSQSRAYDSEWAQADGSAFARRNLEPKP